MKTIKSFIQDEHARIPFSVIGVFLLLGSSFTTVYIAQLEEQKASEITSTLDFNKVEQLIRYAEADIARGLNYAGMKALEYIGKHPVTYSDLPSPTAEDYADSDGDGNPDITGDNDEIDCEAEAVIFNMNWAKNITSVNLNEYLEENFMHDRFKQQDFAVNVKTHDDGIPVDDWRDIMFQEIQMDLNRPTEILNIMITEKDHCQDDKVLYDTYWAASVDIGITVTDLSSGESWDFTITPRCILTSRFPLLMNLVYTYEDTLTGIEGDLDLFNNKLQILTTLISEIYTEARSLVQWGSGPTKIKNIVDNTWLKYVTNAASLLEQFLVFDSIDPMGLLSLVIHCKDLVGSSSSPDDVIDDWQSGIFNLNVDDDILKTLEELGIDRENASDMINNPMNITNMSAMMQVSIGNLSEDLLYEVDYVYYYHNGSDIVEKDEEFYKQHWDSFEQDGKLYTLGDGDGKIFDRFPDYGSIKQEVADSIDLPSPSIIQDVYTAGFTTDASRSVSSCWDDCEWSPGTHHGVPDELVNAGEWEVESICTSGDPLEEDDLIYSWPYVECWTVYWNRTEDWRICDNYNESCECCNESHIEQHYYSEKHELTFTIDTSFSDDVWDVFFPQVIFDSLPHNQTWEYWEDDNLAVVLPCYVGHFCVDVREGVLNSRSEEGQVDSKTYEYGDGLDYGVERLRWSSDGDKGYIVEALENITELIKADDEYYGNISKEFRNYSTLDDMDRGRQALLENFTARSGIYVDEDYYKNGSKYLSCGARVVALERGWFVEQIRSKLDVSITNDIESEIVDKLGEDGQQKLDDYHDMQEEYGGVFDDLGGLGGIQFGLAMELEREPQDFKEGWSEEVAFAVNQEPDYFLFQPKPEEGGEEEWYFNIRNICLFGPTGLPLLPSPVTPWVVTINLWTIEVDGAYESFTIIDTLGEGHVNPLFGHEGQIYKRLKDRVKDELCSGEPIGQTDPINFNFWTMNFGIVPPGRLPIGDQTGGIVEFTDSEPES